MPSSVQWSAPRVGPAARHARLRWLRQRRAADPLFARAKNDDAGTVAHHAEPISDSALDAFITRVQAAFAKRYGAALPVAIKPVRVMDDLPPALQESARRQQLGLGKGAYWEYVVYEVQQAHGTPEEVDKSIFHELYDHATALFGGEWQAK
jgi:hypothetical protein